MVKAGGVILKTAKPVPMSRMTIAETTLHVVSCFHSLPSEETDAANLLKIDRTLMRRVRMKTLRLSVVFLSCEGSRGGEFSDIRGSIQAHLSPRQVDNP